MSNESITNSIAPEGCPAPTGSVALVAHRCSFRAAYRIGSSWIEGTESDSLKEAMEEISEWRNKHRFQFPMRITKTKTSTFSVH